MKEREFCTNSRQWLEFLVLKHPTPPKSCPRRNAKYTECQYCGYLEKRFPNNAFMKKYKILMGYK